MKRLLMILVAIILAMTLLAGCAGDSKAPGDAPAASEEKKETAEVKSDKPEIVPIPLDPNLNYVDTEYMMTLIKNEKPVSTERLTYEQYPAEWSFVLIDSRPEAKYNEGHINGAVNIPDAKFDEFPCRLPEDKDTMLIFYCGGLDCPLSSSSAKKAIEAGYTNVHVYQEGTPFWQEAGNYFSTTPAYVAALITEDYVNNTEKKPFIIIDARPYNLYFKSHIPTAVQMEDIIFEEKYLASMPADKSTEIVVYCGGFFCGKSHAVAKILVANGYTNVKVLAGGNPAWKDAGYPLFGAESSGGSFDISGGKPDRGLTAAEWKKKLDEGKAVVIDVRNASEVANGMIKGAIHIPDTDIHKDPQAIVSKLPADKNTTLLLHCAAGARSAGVVDKIAALGYPNTFYLNNKISIDAEGNITF